MSDPRTAFSGYALCLAGAGFALRLLVAPSYGLGGVDGDLIELKQAVHVALDQGFHEIYRKGARNDPALTGRDWDGGYFTNQLPVIHYLRAVTGAAYRALDPAGFALWPPELNFLEAEQTDLGDRLANSRGFTVALKLPGIVADALLTLALFAFAADRVGERQGLLIAGAYAFNPGVVFDTAYWGQHDAVAAGFVALGLLFVHRGWLAAGFAMAALGGLSKPQTNAFWPLFLALALVSFPWPRVVRAGLAAAAVAVLVFSPFLMGRTLGVSLDALFRSTFGGEPFVACNANNLWWLVSGGRGYELSDTDALVGPFTPRLLGLLAFGAACGLAAWRVARRPDPDGTLGFLAAAVVGMSFFSFATELHENHMMTVVPMLGFALAGDRRLWPVFVLLSISFLLNMALFDPSVVGDGDRWPWSPATVRSLSLAVAAANTAALLALWRRYWRRTEALSSSS